MRYFALTFLLFFAFLLRPFSVDAQQSLQQGTRELANQVITKISKEQKKTIAIVPFRDLNGSNTQLGAFIAEELTSQLFDVPGIRIIERTLLDTLMAELKLNASGAVDSTAAKQLGKLAGADAIITGTTTDLNSAIAINCRLIDTETGTVFGAAQGRIVKDDDVKRLLLAGRNGTKEDLPVDTSTKSSTDSSRKALRGAADGFTFELQTCRASGGGVVCQFLVTNEREDFPLRLDQDTRLFDGGGREFQASRLTIANRETAMYGQGVTLVTGVRTPATIEFENIGDLDRISLLEVKGYARSWYVVRFRNVSLKP